MAKCIKDYGKCDIGIFKRTELKLRYHYYGLKTRLFQTGERKWVIQLLNYTEQLESVNSYFQHYIRPMTLHITLTNQEPRQYISEIEPLEGIADSEEGIFMTGAMLDVYMKEHYPDLPYEGYKGSWGNSSNEHAFCVTVMISKEVATSVKNKIEKDLLDLGIGICQVEIEVVCTEKHHHQSVSVELLEGFHSSVAVKRDTEFWFDCMKQIYRGDIRLADLPCSQGKENVSRCYIQCTTWSHPNLNIRDLILLYDQVFLAFPLREYMDSFFAEQQLRKEDIIDLVISGRLVVVCVLDERRYDFDFIDTLYRCNDAGVVTRRGVNAIYATYLRTLYTSSENMWSMYDEALSTFEMMQNSKLGQQLSDVLLWPYRALENSFDCLSFYQPYKIASIGPNKLFSEEYFKEKDFSNARFELSVNADTIMFASALQATYFPFEQMAEHGVYSDSPATEILGELLNMYRYPLSYFNEETKRVSDVLHQAKAKINLVRPEDNLSIKYLIDVAQRYHTSISLQALLEKIIQLPPEQQKQKILEYNNLLAELSKQNENVQEHICATNYMIQLAGFFPKVGIFASGAGLLQNVMKDIKKKQNQKRMEQKLQAGRLETIEDEVYLLDRLSRVAKLEYR